MWENVRLCDVEGLISMLMACGMNTYMRRNIRRVVYKVVYAQISGEEGMVTIRIQCKKNKTSRYNCQ